jgi:hypothetical protein
MIGSMLGHYPTEQGEIREHVNVFVGSEHVKYTGGLRTGARRSGNLDLPFSQRRMTPVRSE